MTKSRGIKGMCIFDQGFKFNNEKRRKKRKRMEEKMTGTVHRKTDLTSSMPTSSDTVIQAMKYVLAISESLFLAQWEQLQSI
jgi:hypothetical protein